MYGTVLGKIGPRSFLYGPRCAQSVLPRPRANIPLYGPHVLLVRVLLVISLKFYIIFLLLGSSQYVAVGCFKDELVQGQRALPELLANYRGKLDWNNLNQYVEKCALEAKKRNYMHFGYKINLIGYT